MTAFSHEQTDLGGCLYEADNFTPNESCLLIYFSAEGLLNQAVEAAKANDGHVTTPVEAIGPYGFRAIIKDCSGNKIALYSKVN